VEQLTLREARTRRGFTQAQLAEKSGVEQAVISKLERGVVKNPGFRIVLKLAEALRLDPRALRIGRQPDEAFAS
jgi:transcriptional regulator with XRE-family HTH domain